MSAPDPRGSFSETGFEDGLGRRTLVFDRASGTAVERLTLRPEFGLFERALRDRAARLADWQADGLARPVRVHRDGAAGALCVDAERPSGHRLSDVLEAARDGWSDQPIVGLCVALGCLDDVLATVERLHRESRLTHGTIAPARVLLTPAGRLTLLDPIYADPLERLAWPADRLWRELGIAAVPGSSRARFAPAADVAQAGLTALALLLGRPLTTRDSRDRFAAALVEAREIAELHSGPDFADGVEALFARLLPFAAEPFARPAEAREHAQRLAGPALGLEVCRAALATAAGAMAGLPAQKLPELGEATASGPATGSASPAAAPEPPQPPPLDLRIDVAAPAGVRPSDAAPASAASGKTETAGEPSSTTMPEPAGPVDTPGPPPPTAERHPQPSAEAPAPSPEPGASADRDAAPPELPVAGGVGPAAPAPAAAASHGRGKRERRRKDKLRSAHEDTAPREPAAPETPAQPAVPAPATPPAPMARPPLMPIRPAPAPSFPQPAFPQPGTYGAAAPLSPYQDGPERAYAIAPFEGAAPPPPPVASPAAPAVGQGTPISVKGAPAARPVRERVEPNPYERALEATPAPRRAGGGRAWKLAGAAVIVLLAGVAAGRAYLTDRPASAAPPAPEASASASPAPAPPPTVPLVGGVDVTSTPAGARVLLNGKPVGETPLALTGLPAGRHTLTFQVSGGSVTRTVQVAAGETASVDVAVFSGWLVVDAPIVLDVAQAGRVIGTSQARLLLPPGRHTVTLTNKDLGYRANHAVEIVPGEERRLTLVPSTEVNLNAVPWAEVWVDGRRVGETPVARVSIPLGTREVVFRHPEFGERRLTPTIRVGAPEALSVDFTRSGGA